MAGRRNRTALEGGMSINTNGKLIFNALKRTFFLFVIFSLTLFFVFTPVGLAKEPFSYGELI